MRSLPFRKYFQIIVGLFNTLVHEKLHHLQLEVTLKYAIILCSLYRHGIRSLFCGASTGQIKAVVVLCAVFRKIIP